MVKIEFTTGYAVSELLKRAHSLPFSVRERTGIRNTTQALWDYLAEALQRHNAPNTQLWQDQLQWVLQQGPLSRRIMRALG